MFFPLNLFFFFLLKFISSRDEKVFLEWLGISRAPFSMVCLCFQLLCILYLSSLRPTEGHSDQSLVLKAFTSSRQSEINNVNHGYNFDSLKTNGVNISL